MLKKKRLLILGITGSIGTQALECLHDEIDLVGFSYFNNHQLAMQIKNKHPNVIIYSKKFTNENNIKSYQDLITVTKPDLILNAVSGWEGFELTKLIINNKIDIALANKESLVIGGKLIVDLAIKNNVKILPVDSEHSAVHELIQIDNDNIKSIYITASGGRFFNEIKNNQADNISFKDALVNPNWQMGERISIDSSTLVNKCYELIELVNLFSNKYIIKAIRHKQSKVHAIIEYKNNSLLFSVSEPDMKLAIGLALNDFDRSKCFIKQLDFKSVELSFEEIDSSFLPIKWFNEFASSLNYAIGPIINITNEFCFDLFKSNKIKFNQIVKIIDDTLNKFKNKYLIKEFVDLDILKKDLTHYLQTHYKG